MAHKRKLSTVLDADFLKIRARIVELAADFDRLDAAAVAQSGHHADPRFDELRAAVSILNSAAAARAERVQRHFSLEYDSDWMRRFELTPAARRAKS